MCFEKSKKSLLKQLKLPKFKYLPVKIKVNNNLKALSDLKKKFSLLFFLESPQLPYLEKV